MDLRTRERALRREHHHGPAAAADLHFGCAAQTIPVSETSQTTVEPFIYTVATKPVEIDLGPGSFPSLDPAFDDAPKATVTLTTTSVTGPAAVRSYTLERRARQLNILVVNGVAPEVGAYTLSFNDALHAPLTNVPVTIALAVNGNDRRVGTLAAAPAPDATRWTGTVQQRVGSSTSPNNGLANLSGDAVMLLTRTTGGPTYRLAPNPTTIPNSAGNVARWSDLQLRCRSQASTTSPSPRPGTSR